MRRLSGEAFFRKAVERAGVPYPWDAARNRPLTLRDESALIRAATELAEDTSYAAKLGLNYTAVTSVPGYVARNSRTLRSAIQRSKRYTVFSAASLDYDLREGEEVSSFWVRSMDPVVDRSILDREFAVFTMLSIFRFLLERPIVPEEITFRHRRSEGGERLAKLAGCDVIWGAAEDSLRFSKATLDLPIPSYDPRLRDLVVQHGESLLAARNRRSASLRDRMEPLILDGFQDGAPSADDIAAKLGMSRRTLTRRLSEEGLTYRQVLDGVRLDVAYSYLRDTSLSLAEIAFQLGYADQAAFTTAYKRWTGKTPSSERNAATIG